MAITPNTWLRLVQTPIEIDNKNQLTFENSKKQADYFFSLSHLEITEISYQRKDNAIMFPEHIDKLLKYNYVIYMNENYGTKIFYAFITGMEYINDGCTKIYITTDVFQTWQFDLNFKDSFIEREMIDVDKDVPGANLLPEGLEIGELKMQGTAEFDELEPVYIVAFMGDKYGDEDINQNGFEYNGIWSSVTFFVTNSLKAGLSIINAHGQGDKILTVFSIPKLAVLDFIPPDVNENNEKVYYFTPIEENFKQSEIFKTLIRLPENIDGYIPKNQKLRTYPYIYLGFNPSNGSKKIYRYENFVNYTPIFKIISEINPNPTIEFIPKDYNGSIGDNLGEKASLNGYPNISYKNDYFNTWLAQNSDIVNLQMSQEQFNYTASQVQTGVNAFGNMLSTLGGDTKSAGGYVSNLFELAKADVNHDFYIKQQMAQIEKQKLLPDNANLSSSNSTLMGYNLNDKNIFTRYSIKRQFAERIDKYFDMYGYLTNTVKIPNLKNRPNWNYVKTIGVNIIADIPQEDLQTIKKIFDNGVTLWHNPNTFLDYKQNNR